MDRGSREASAPDGLRAMLAEVLESSLPVAAVAVREGLLDAEPLFVISALVLALRAEGCGEEVVAEVERLLVDAAVEDVEAGFTDLAVALWEEHATVPGDVPPWVSAGEAPGTVDDFPEPGEHLVGGAVAWSIGEPGRSDEGSRVGARPAPGVDPQRAVRAPHEPVGVDVDPCAVVGESSWLDVPGVGPRDGRRWRRAPAMRCPPTVPSSVDRCVVAAGRASERGPPAAGRALATDSPSRDHEPRGRSPERAPLGVGGAVAPSTSRAGNGTATSER